MVSFRMRSTLTTTEALAATARQAVQLAFSGFVLKLLALGTAPIVLILLAKAALS